MTGEVERFIRIQSVEIMHTLARPTTKTWHSIRDGDRVRLQDYLVLTGPREEADMAEKRHIFRIKHISGIQKGFRVTYFGNHFTVLEISDPGGLTGLELTCVAERD